ncbi:MAG TPA: hypothetical protein VFG69_04380 [Nannocystaceae bacterium]|nr:hypothetical protein [Nannocystaceae bacterium]
MRLPLRHRPPLADARAQDCRHLDALARAAVGLPLGPAAALLSSARSRGRHGNALQWHLGLAPHDGEATLDWEDRIEVKLVSVWRSGDRVVCDKLKVCDADLDPWRKLANVLWVFVDRSTRVVVGSAKTTMAGAMRERLAAVWDRDPHFDRPDLFVEARDGEAGPAPAYYLAATWLAREAILPALTPGIFSFTPRLWSRAIAESGREPVLTVVRDGEEIRACPRCGAPFSFAPGDLARRGLALAHHGLPLPRSCAPALHVAVDGTRLPAPTVLAAAEQIAALEGRTPLDAVPRLCDRVAEPDDHAH